MRNRRNRKDDLVVRLPQKFGRGGSLSRRNSQLVRVHCPRNHHRLAQSIVEKMHDIGSRRRWNCRRGCRKSSHGLSLKYFGLYALPSQTRRNSSLKHATKSSFMLCKRMLQPFINRKDDRRAGCRSSHCNATAPIHALDALILPERLAHLEKCVPLRTNALADVLGLHS